MKILDQHGLEIALPSPNDRERTSYGMIFRGKSRFVDEVHFPNAELRSSAELLSELQKSGRGEPCLTESKTGNQETGAVCYKFNWHQGNLCGHPQHFSQPSVFLHTKTIPTTKRKWKVIATNSSFEGVLSIAVSKMVTRMVRHYDHDEGQSDA